ncbi:MAG: MerR family transcriptional regulator [Lachnospiraceae bacterium]|nr:MerR family transcriptional regulator [Lachnospiraceae bacterium]
MDQVRYMISDAAKLVEVESHVLRYWEEELELPIARNEMGHRYYTQDDIQLLKHIKILKERGYQLKAIKMDISENGELIPREETLPQELGREKTEVIDSNAEKMQQFQSVLSKALGQALRENQDSLGRELGGRVADQVTKEINYQFRAQEERQEAYYRKLDEKIQTVKKRNAKVKKEKPEKKRRVFFRKKQKIQTEAAEPT